MVRVLFAFVAIVVGALTLSSPRQASAYDTWCADDPIVWIGGHLLDVQVQMPVSRVLTMRSTTLTIIIPRNVPGFVLVDDISAFPMTTTVSARGPRWDGKGSLPITIIASVQATTSYEVRVTATPLLNSHSLTAGAASTLASAVSGPAMTTGVTNTNVVLPFQLGR
jgi:hypothetical protein